MALIKCYECGKEISDLAQQCIQCGAPKNKDEITQNEALINTAAIKKSFEKLADMATEVIDKSVDYGKELVRSQDEKDADAVDSVISNPNDIPIDEECQMFNAALESTIDMKVAEILSSKEQDEQYLNYIDSQILTSSVKNVYKRVLGLTPPQIEAACYLCSAVLAPSSKEKQNLIKAAVGLAGGATGIGMIIGGIGSALGWGAGMIASLGAFFAGSSVAGPVGWVVAGVSLAATAGYFASTSNKETDTERFIKVLKSSTTKATEAIWSEFGEKLWASMPDDVSAN